MRRDEAIRRLRERRSEFERLGVERLYLFGSTARHEARQDSDVDLVFDYPRGKFGLYELFDVEDLAADDYRRNSPRFQGENFQKNLDLAARIGEMAKKKGCTASQLALAWLLAQGADIVPIPGTKRRSYLEENAGATDVTLSAAELAAIDAVAPKGVAAGERYPEAGMRAVNG